jgi:hypothetical protein
VTRFEHAIAWRRFGAPRHYAGGLDLGDGVVVLNGREPSTGVEVSLRIPRHAVRALRLAMQSTEEVVGERGLVMELADEVPILLRPLGLGDLHEEDLAAALADALDLPAPGLTA